MRALVEIEFILSTRVDRDAIVRTQMLFMNYLRLIEVASLSEMNTLVSRSFDQKLIFYMFNKRVSNSGLNRSFNLTVRLRPAPLLLSSPQTLSQMS